MNPASPRIPRRKPRQRPGLAGEGERVTGDLPGSGLTERLEARLFLPIHLRVQARPTGRDERAQAQRVAAQLVGTAEAVATGASAGPLLRRLEEKVRFGDAVGRACRMAGDIQQLPVGVLQRRARHRLLAARARPDALHAVNYHVLEQPVAFHGGPLLEVTAENDE